MEILRIQGDTPPYIILMLTITLIAFLLTIIELLPKKKNLFPFMNTGFIKLKWLTFSCFLFYALTHLLALFRIIFNMPKFDPFIFLLLMISTITFFAFLLFIVYYLCENMEMPPRNNNEPL